MSIIIFLAKNPRVVAQAKRIKKFVKSQLVGLRNAPPAQACRLRCVAKQLVATVRTGAGQCGQHVWHQGFESFKKDPGQNKFSGVSQDLSGQSQ